MSNASFILDLLLSEIKVVSLLVQNSAASLGLTVVQICQQAFHLGCAVYLAQDAALVLFIFVNILHVEAFHELLEMGLSSPIPET